MYTCYGVILNSGPPSCRADYCYRKGLAFHLNGAGLFLMCQEAGPWEGSMSLPLASR